MSTHSKGTVLIIEDNQMNMDMAKELLEFAGFQTLEAEDAEKGIELAQTHIPDLILLDLHLPVINGFEMIKAMPRIQHVPIVAFTALAMESDHHQALANGCISVINKPINVDLFVDTIAHIIEESKAVVS
jgi:CheY-like chemotaxis protein